jgi:hypothetical protein
MTGTFKLNSCLLFVTALLHTLHIIIAKDCPEGEFVHGESCMPSCPQAYWNRTCVKECPPGFYTELETAHRKCLGCEPGTFTSHNGSRICNPCQRGQFQVRSCFLTLCPKLYSVVCFKQNGNGYLIFYKFARLREVS